MQICTSLLGVSVRLDVYFVLLSGKTVLNECQTPEDPLRVYKTKKQNVVIPNYTVVILQVLSKPQVRVHSVYL